MAATLTILNKVPYHIVVDFTTFGQCGADGLCIRSRSRLTLNAVPLAVCFLSVTLVSRKLGANFCFCVCARRRGRARTRPLASRALSIARIIRELAANFGFCVRARHRRRSRRPRDVLEACADKLPSRVPLNALKVRIEKPVIFNRRVKGAPSSYAQTSRGRSARRVTGNGLAKPPTIGGLTNIGIPREGRANFGCGCGGTGCASRRRASRCGAGCSRRCGAGCSRRCGAGCSRPANAGHGASRSGRVTEEIKLAFALTIGERIKGCRIPNPTYATGSSPGKTGAGIQSAATATAATNSLSEHAEQGTQADNGFQGSKNFLLGGLRRIRLGAIRREQRLRNQAGDIVGEYSKRIFFLVCDDDFVSLRRRRRRRCRRRRRRITITIAVVVFLNFNVN